MRNKINWYKELSLNMLKALKEEEYDKFDLIADERQRLIDIISKNNEIEHLRSLYNKHNLETIDIEMRNLVEFRIKDVKKEIKSHRLKMQINSSYNNMKKEKINIFSAKV